MKEIPLGSVKDLDVPEELQRFGLTEAHSDFTGVLRNYDRSRQIRYDRPAKYFSDETDPFRNVSDLLINTGGRLTKDNQIYFIVTMRHKPICLVLFKSFKITIISK